MKILQISILVLIVSMASAFAQNYSYNYEEMTEEQYLAELQKWQDRLSTADRALLMKMPELPNCSRSWNL